MGPNGLIRDWNTRVDELVFLNLMTGARRLLMCPNIRGSSSKTRFLFWTGGIGSLLRYISFVCQHAYSSAENFQSFF